MRARNDIGDIASGLTGGELRRALTDRGHPPHKRAVEIWNDSHKVAFGQANTVDDGVQVFASARKALGL